MEIKKLVLGELKTNCYILVKDGNALVIDPAGEYDKIKAATKDYEVVGVLITHYHCDHIGAIQNFDENIIRDHYNLEEGECSIENFKFEVIHTPGHTDDCMSYYFYEDKVLFSGDFIFYESVGRYDFATSDFEELLDSIEKIKKYPGDIKVYPGHGESTTLEHEIENNIYFRLS